MMAVILQVKTQSVFLIRQAWVRLLAIPPSKATNRLCPQSPALFPLQTFCLMWVSFAYCCGSQTLTTLGSRGAASGGLWSRFLGSAWHPQTTLQTSSQGHLSGAHTENCRAISRKAVLAHCLSSMHAYPLSRLGFLRPPGRGLPHSPLELAACLLCFACALVPSHFV